MGNRLSRNDSAEGSTSYIYDNNDRLLKSTINGIVTDYNYDDNGNLISQNFDGKTTSYIWDDRDRLVEAQTADGNIIGYEYNDENIRVSSTINGVKTTYLVDSNRPYAQVIEEYEDENLKARFFHGLDLISFEQDGEVSIYLMDGLGSNRVLTDVNGEVVASYTYEAFGNLIDSTGTVENNYLFAGEQYDENLEQYYLRQRYYDADIGRFTRRDTYEGSINEPITLHKYLYGNANPVIYTDPSGLFSLPRVLAAVGTIATAGYAVIFGRDHFFRGNSGNNNQLFNTSDDAALAVLRQINPKSIQENKEYGGRICKSLTNHKYFYTEPLSGGEAAVHPGFCPLLSTPQGNYHTHGAPDPTSDYGEWVSQADFDVIKGYWFDKVGYLATPNGVVKKFTPANENYFITDGRDGQVIATGVR